LDQFKEKLPLKIASFAKNRGLGAALAHGIELCEHELIARMDTDDICSPLRFEKQIEYMKENEAISVVGTWITEFEEDPDLVSTVRRLPIRPDALKVFAKSRNPLNHQ